MTRAGIQCEVDSVALGRRCPFMAFAPDENRDQPMPVLYLLHGATGNYMDWSTHAGERLRSLACDLQVIIINPDGGEFGWYLDSPIIKGNQYESFLTRELIPTVDARFNTTAQRGIAGLSMGGHGALTLAWKYPDLFASVSAMSAVVDLTFCRLQASLTALLGDYQSNQERWHSQSARHLLMHDPTPLQGLPLHISCGHSDYYFESNRSFSELLNDLGVVHEFVDAPGGHEWSYWTAQLPGHARWHAAKLRPDV